MPSTDLLRTTVLLVSNSTGQTGRVEIMDLSGRGNEWLGSRVLEYPISMQKAESPWHPCAPRMGHHLSLGGPLRVPLSFGCDPWPCISLTICPICCRWAFLLETFSEATLGFSSFLSSNSSSNLLGERHLHPDLLIFGGQRGGIFFNSCYYFLIKKQ